MTLERSHVLNFDSWTSRRMLLLSGDSKKLAITCAGSDVCRLSGKVEKNLCDFELWDVASLGSKTARPAFAGNRGRLVARMGVMIFWGILIFSTDVLTVFQVEVTLSSLVIVTSVVENLVPSSISS